MTPQRTVGKDVSQTAFTPVKSADRVLEILEVLATAQAPWSLADLSETLNIPKSSLHGLLRTLQGRRWIEADGSGHEFRLGVRALLVGASYVDTDAQVVRTRATLDHLAERTGETVHLGRLDGTDIVYLAKRESRHPLRLFSAIGRRLPAYATALGKAILAEHDRESVDARFEGPLDRLTENTVSTLPKLHDALTETKRRGYAIDQEENAHGICCFAVALPYSGPAEDAISVSIPLMRATTEHAEEVVRLLLDAQRAFSRGGQ